MFLTRQQIIDLIEEGLYDDEGNYILPRLLTRLQLEKTIEDSQEQLDIIEGHMWANLDCKTFHTAPYDKEQQDKWRKEYLQIQDKIKNFEKEIEKLCM